jgi:hypothetical protein
MLMILFSMILSQMFVMEGIPQKAGEFHLRHHPDNADAAAFDDHRAADPGGHGGQRRHRHHPDCAAAAATDGRDRHQPGAFRRHHGRQRPWAG